MVNVLIELLGAGDALSLFFFFCEYVGLLRVFRLMNNGWIDGVIL